MPVGATATTCDVKQQNKDIRVRQEKMLAAMAVQGRTWQAHPQMAWGRWLKAHSGVE